MSATDLPFVVVVCKMPQHVAREPALRVARAVGDRHAVVAAEDRVPEAVERQEHAHHISGFHQPGKNFAMTTPSRKIGTTTVAIASSTPPTEVIKTRSSSARPGTRPAISTPGRGRSARGRGCRAGHCGPAETASPRAQDGS